MQTINEFICGRCLELKPKEELSRHYGDKGDLCSGCRLKYGNYTWKEIVDEIIEIRDSDEPLTQQQLIEKLQECVPNG